MTRPRHLGIAALAGGIAGGVLVTVARLVAGYPPVLPWTGPLVLIFMAAVVGAVAYTTWRRVQTRRESMEPERGIGYLALGKASALGGVAIAAGYLALVVLSLDNLSAVGPQQRVVRGLVAVLGGILLSGAGLWLERACRVPEPPDDDTDSAADLT